MFDELVPGYRIVRQVGVGAGSKIILATDLRTGKSVAIKHILRETPDSDKLFEQLENEYRVTHKLDHPNLRKSFLVHRVRKLLQVKEIMLVMEYVDGLSLEAARPNRLATFLTLFQKIAGALDALHHAGFVHADIKPTNILLGRGGVLKIIDFGQACRMNHRKERVQGTPDYIAPEQVRRLALDRRTDVFNLGATMYWVLTSEKYPTAIQGTDPRGGIRLITSDKPLAPIELNDKIPLSLSKLVMECCRENPAERPSDMKQVAARLVVVSNLWKKHLDSKRADQRPRSESADPVQATIEPLAANEAPNLGDSGNVSFNDRTVRSIEDEE